MKIKEKIKTGELEQTLREHLVQQILPFWMKYGIDEKNGGIYSMIGEDGTLHSKNKYLWFQGRGLWTFSALYEYIEPNPRWKEIADRIFEFIIRHGQTEGGKWVFAVSENGRKIVEPPKSHYVDAFMIMGFTQYARITNNPKAIALAKETCKSMVPMILDHGLFQSAPHFIPEDLQSHGVYMMFSHVFHELGVLTKDKEILDYALAFAEKIMTEHVDWSHQVLLEFVGRNGKPVHTDAGYTYLPGHAIESMWFLERIYAYHGMHKRQKETMEIIRWHMEKGWDEEYGGLYLACHLKKGTPIWHDPTSKQWWPMTEALYGLLKAYDVLGEDWCLEWYEKSYNYTFSKFPNKEFGEWHYSFDRQGHPREQAIKDWQVKDPYHISRFLIYSILLLQDRM